MRPIKLQPLLFDDLQLKANREALKKRGSDFLDADRVGKLYEELIATRAAIQKYADQVVLRDPALAELLLQTLPGARLDPKASAELIALYNSKPVPDAMA